MLALGIIYLLFASASTLRWDKSVLFNRIAIIILIYSILLGINSVSLVSLNMDVDLFNNLFHINTVTHFFNIFLYLIIAILLQLTAFYPRRILADKSGEIKQRFLSEIKYRKPKVISKQEDIFKMLEYPLIALFIALGATVLMLSNNLISMFLSIELQSYGLYILATLIRSSENATLAGLTYFLLGGLSSCFILLGSAILYINTGVTNIDDIFMISYYSNIDSILNDVISNNYILNFIHEYNNIYYVIGFSIILIGYLFKVSAAPFHFWSPEVYDQVPTIVTSFIAIVPKISIFIFIVKLIHNNLDYYGLLEINYVLLLSSFFSLIIGSIVGLDQSRIKKLFAYSTISHVGFILLALTLDTTESIQAFFFYIIQYTFSNLNLFLLLIAIGYYNYFYDSSKNTMYDKTNSPIQYIHQIKGFYYKNPLIAISLSITIFSFAGIPPLVGFFAKQMVLYAALQKGYVFISLVAILTSVISAVYYLGIVKKMFFENSHEIKHNLNLSEVEVRKLTFKSNKDENSLENNKDFEVISNNTTYISSYITITISILSLSILLFILYPHLVLNFVTILTISISNK